MKKRVLAGMRPSGVLHIGNYLGSLKGMIELQKNQEFESFFMVVDLHGLTTPYDKKQLAGNTRNILIDYLSCGLNPEKSTLFVQSHVREHAEFSFFCATMSTVARCGHLPTYKEKIKQFPQNVTMAMLNYPIL